MKKLLFLFFFILLSPFTSAEEKILNYEVSFNLNKNASAEITENITVNAEHNKIKRGIYRVIPHNSNQKIKVLHVTMDAEEVPAKVSQKNNSIRIDIGDDTYISHGNHTYKLVYTMTNAVKYHFRYDEIYWNVTGNAWAFPIEKATFLFPAHKGIEIIPSGISYYTGIYGSKGKNIKMQKVTISAKSDKELFPTVDYYSFSTTAPIPPKSGFTVAIPFKPGFIQLNPKDRISMFITNYLIVLLFPIVLLYYLITWYFLGKDPRYNGKVLYAPPNGISPAMLRYIRFRKADDITFSAALVNLAIKKKISIKTKGDKIRLIRKVKSQKGLSEEEKLIMNKLFMRDIVIIGNTYKKNIAKVFKQTNQLIKQKGKNLVRKNLTLLIFPTIVLILMAISLTSLYSFVTIIILFTIFLMIKLDRNGRILIGILLATYLTPILFLMKFDLNIIAYFIALAIFIPYFLFIDNTTTMGRAIFLDTLAFEDYIKKAEKYRTKLSHPEDNLKIFTEYLPYAYALGLQSEWIKYFSTVISKNILDNEMNRFDGHIIFKGNFLQKNLSSTLNHNSSGGMRSGSGSFGGGFSGGGFGGGGGGGR